MPSRAKRKKSSPTPAASSSRSSPAKPPTHAPSAAPAAKVKRTPSKSAAAPSPPASPAVWEWEEFGVFRPYDDNVVAAIEKEFQAGKKTAELNVDVYYIDFGNWFQINRDTGFARQIRRSTDSDSSDESDEESEIEDEDESDGKSTPNPRPRKQRRQSQVRTKPGRIDATDTHPEHLLESQDFTHFFKPAQIPDDGEEHRCSVCMDDFDESSDDTKPIQLSKCPAEHFFHADCITPWLKDRKTCPVCFHPYGIRIGTQPPGTMSWIVGASSLPGYAGSGTIEIVWSFDSGTQGEHHPQPGLNYHGDSRQAFLPDTPEGREILELFKIAFTRRLFFTIGRSITRNIDNVIVWNGIHAKTCQGGGAANFGFPDPTYFDRVKEELSAKGIVPDDIES